MDEPQSRRWRASLAQVAFERTLFGSWLLAPFYLGLALSLGVLLSRNS